MTKGIEIDVGMNVRKFQAGASDVEAGFSDVADSLDDLAKQGEKAGDQLADGLKDGGKQGEAALQRVEDAFRDLTKGSSRAAADVKGDLAKSERSFKDLADTAKRESKQAGDELGRNVKRGTEQAEDGFGELKDEARQSARETAASFKEVSDVGDLVQETLANAFVGFGPLAAVASLAAAAGFGILTEAIRNDTEASKQRVASMYDDMTESGNKYLSDSYKREAINAILKDEEGALASLSTAQEIATRTGSDLSTVINGLIGDTTAQAEVLANARRAHEEADAAQAKYIETNGQASAAIGEQIGALDSAENAFNRVNGEQATAAERAQILGAAMSDTAGGLGAAADKAQYLKDKLASLPTSGTYRLDVDDSALERALTRQQGRTISVNVEGVITRIGNQVY